MIREDFATEFRDAFERRAYQNSDAARFEQEQTTLDADAAGQQNEQAGRDFLKGLGLGDTIPSPDDYDYGKMLADGVHPRPDKSGRLPLPPRYFRSGKLILDGVDVSTGKRILSRQPLEDRILSGNDLDGDGEPDDPAAILAAAIDDPASELTPAERASLSAWREQRNVMLADASGAVGTRTDAPQAMIGEIPRTTMQSAIGNMGSWLQRMAEELDRHGISIPMPGGGEVNPTLKDVTLGDLGRVIEDMSYGFYPVKGSGMTTQVKPDAMELMNMPIVSGAVAGAAKAARAMPKTAAAVAGAAAMSASDRAEASWLSKLARKADLAGMSKQELIDAAKAGGATRLSEQTAENVIKAAKGQLPPVSIKVGPVTITEGDGVSRGYYYMAANEDRVSDVMRTLNLKPAPDPLDNMDSILKKWQGMPARRDGNRVIFGKVAPGQRATGILLNRDGEPAAMFTIIYGGGK